MLQPCGLSSSYFVSLSYQQPDFSSSGNFVFILSHHHHHHHPSYRFFKAFHHPLHPHHSVPYHHHHHKVVRYVTYYDEPLHYPSYHEPAHTYHSSYSIDRADDEEEKEEEEEEMMGDCYSLTSPNKELCVLCGREETEERRALCLEDPCLLVKGEERELCDQLTNQYLDMFRQ